MRKLKTTWSEEEDKLLRELAPTVSVQRLSVKLKRSAGALTGRARELNVQFLSPKHFGSALTLPATIAKR